MSFQVTSTSAATRPTRSRQRVLALVLAGGEGNRLGALTQRRAKPVLPVIGVYRLIDVPLSQCVHSGISDVWVIEQFRPHSLNDHLVNGRPWDLDRTWGGLRILPPFTGPDEDDGGGMAEGNAQALWQHRSAIRAFAADLVLVLSADHLYRLDYRDVIDAHVARGQTGVTMVTTRVPRADASRFGVVQSDGEGRVTAFDYKPERPASDEVTAEIFVYDSAELLDALGRLATAVPDEDDTSGGRVLKDFGDTLLPDFVSRDRAWTFPLAGYWRDVGVVESYWQAHQDFLAVPPPLDLDDPAWPLLTTGTPRTPARIAAGARVLDSLVSAGCELQGTVERSVLGPGVLVEPGATVRDAVVLHDAVIRAGATVERAVIDAHADIGANARVGAASAPPDAGRGGIAVVGMGVCVAPGEVVRPGEERAPGDDEAGDDR